MWTILLDQNFLSAILISLFFIFLGFILRKKQIIDDNGKKLITFIVLKITLPVMAFTAFMKDFDSNEFSSNITVFIIAIVLYSLYLIIGNLLFSSFGREKSKVYSVFMTVGQLTFFSLPILEAIYGDNVLLPINMITLVFRFVLYVYSYFIISKLSFNRENIIQAFKKIFVNPIMIGMLIGLFVWVSQGFMFKVSINEATYSILRIDKTIPVIYNVMKKIDGLTTPLAMILIGCTLGESSIKEAIKDKMAWLISILRTFIVPLLTLGIVYLIQKLNVCSLNEYAIVALILGFGAPISAVLNAFCSKYDNESQLSSRICLVSILMCLISFPTIYLLIKIIFI